LPFAVLEDDGRYPVPSHKRQGFPSRLARKRPAGKIGSIRLVSAHDSLNLLRGGALAPSRFHLDYLASLSSTLQLSRSTLSDEPSLGCSPETILRTET